MAPADIEALIAAVVDRAGPATVGVRSRTGAGSGIVVAAGTVVTNAHNAHADVLQVIFPDGRTEEGEVVAGDADADLAVLQVDTGAVEPISWAPVDTDVRMGTTVVALANPAGTGLRATFGTVSSLGRAFRGPRGRRITGSVEHTAPLPRGSSGGPVVDADGRLLGINTSRLGEGFYLAMPADEHLRARVDALRGGTVPRRVELGVAIAPARVARRLRAAVGLPDRDGLLVHSVVDDGAAARGGISRGDLLVGADGTPLARVDDLHRVLDGKSSGSTMAVQVVRGVEEQSVTVSFR